MDGNKGGYLGWGGTSVVDRIGVLEKRLAAGNGGRDVLRRVERVQKSLAERYPASCETLHNISEELRLHPSSQTGPLMPVDPVAVRELILASRSHVFSVRKQLDAVKMLADEVNTEKLRNVVKLKARLHALSSDLSSSLSAAERAHHEVEALLQRNDEVMGIVSQCFVAWDARLRRLEQQRVNV